MTLGGSKMLLYGIRMEFWYTTVVYIVRFLYVVCCELRLCNMDCSPEEVRDMAVAVTDVSVRTYNRRYIAGCRTGVLYC